MWHARRWDRWKGGDHFIKKDVWKLFAVDGEKTVQNPIVNGCVGGRVRLLFAGGFCVGV
jgi:hypothetical protein